jgi:hypothetical protein
LLAFALKYFFFQRNKELALQRAGAPEAAGAVASSIPAPAPAPETRIPERGRARERDGERERERKDGGSSGRRIYLTWGEVTLPEAQALVSLLAGASGISAEALGRKLRIDGRSAFLELPEQEAEKLLGLHGTSLEGKALRVEPARTPPRRRSDSRRRKH